MAIGLGGIEKRLKLEMKPSHPTKIGVPLTQEQKDEIGVKDRIPDELEKRIEALEKDKEAFEPLLSALLVKTYIAYKRAWIEASKGMTERSRRAAEMWHI